MSSTDTETEMPLPGADFLSDEIYNPEVMRIIQDYCDGALGSEPPEPVGVATPSPCRSSAPSPDHGQMQTWVAAAVSSPESAAPAQHVLPHATPQAPAPVTLAIRPPGDRFAESAVNNAIPALENWQGELGFSVTVRSASAGASSRLQPYVYDPVARKLYVDVLISVPFCFGLAGGAVARGLCISALPVYPELHHVNTPVRRCPTHRELDHATNVDAADHVDHVVRAEHVDATYLCWGSTNERRSVVVPCQEPQPGTNDYQVFYKFGCMNTCVGGINRRRLMVLFTLEDQLTGAALGRQTVEVKVCKCPHRDYKTDLHRRSQPQLPPGRLLPPPPKARKRRREPAGQLAVPVDDEAMYEQLVVFRDSLRVYRARVLADAAASTPVDEQDVSGEVTPPARLQRYPLTPIKSEIP